MESLKAIKPIIQQRIEQISNNKKITLTTIVNKGHYEVFVFDL